MVSSTMLAINIGITIGIIIFFIMVLKINAVVSLILGSLYMGIGSGLGLSESVTSIASGFGGFMTSIGIPIILGIMIGQLLSDSGGARSIANTLVNNVDKKKVPYAIGLAGAILAIPVFFDVVFVILAPLAIALYREAEELSYPAIIGSLAIGAAGAHTFIPPTPNPLASAEILNFPLAHIMGFGLTIGILVILGSIWIYLNLIIDKLWKDEKDIEEIPFKKQVDVDLNTLPSFSVSLFPIAIPILLILIPSIWNVYGEAPYILNEFFGTRIIAMLLGVLAATVIFLNHGTRSQLEESFNEALKPAGIVLGITGAGGSLGAVIAETGGGEALVQGFGISSGITLILLGYTLAAIIRIAQGSGTVASITAMNIIAGASLTGFGVPPFVVALACLAGGVVTGHVNDSGFWVVTKLAGLKVSGGFKTYTLGNTIMSLIMLAVALTLGVVL